MTSIGDALRAIFGQAAPPQPNEPAPPPVTYVFASDRIRREWEVGNLDAKLRQVVNEAAAFAETLGWTFTLTCVIRTPSENSACYPPPPEAHADGVHVRGRGVDIRVYDQNKDVVKAVTDYVNSRWVYDPTRPNLLVALLETAGAGSTGPHLHCQTHEYTVARSDLS